MAVIDIESAVQHTLRSLTLSEKGLAHELLSSEQYHEPSRSVWVRAPHLNLHKAIARIRQDAGSQSSRTPAGEDFPVRNYNLVCDTLTINSTDPITVDQARVFKITIFARRIDAPAAASTAPSLTLQSRPGCNISFGTPNLPDTFEVEFVTDSGAHRIKPKLAKGNFYIQLEHDSSGEIEEMQLGAPDSFMNTINYLDRIDDNGHLKPATILNDDLPRLLQMQLLVAQAHANGTKEEKSFAIDLLNYVVAATATPYSRQQNYQATSFRNALAVESDAMAVPSVNIYSSKQVLKARLAAAMAFENGFQNFSAQEHSQKSRTSQALDLLAKSDDAAEVYKFLLDIRQREYDNAVTAYQKASTNFGENEKDIETKRKAFEAGIAAYKKAQEVKATKKILGGIFKVFVAVVATVATAGAAAPAAIGAAGSAANTAAKTVSLFKKLKAIFDKLKKIYEKIKPVIKKLKELVETATKVVDALKKIGKDTADAPALKAGDISPDVFNATAEWRRFNLTLIEMENSLQEYDINGKGAFFTALKTLVINGEAFIQCQANLVVKGDELATTILQSRMEKRNHDRLAKMCYTSSTDEAVFGLLRRAMFDRLLQIRSLVYLDFSTYVAALNYHTLLPEQVISLSPVKPIVDYLEDAAKLQGAVASFSSRTLIQRRGFKLTVKEANILGQLKKSGVATVSVNPTDTIWNGFTRIRMSSVRCYLEGAKAADGSNIRVQLRTSPQFFDRDLLATDPWGKEYNVAEEVSDEGELEAAEAEEEEPEEDEEEEGEGEEGEKEGEGEVDIRSEKPVLTRSFLGDSRTLLFEYNQGGDVVCDGTFGQRRDYTMHTPMTTWEVKVVGSKGAKKRVDLTGVEGLSLEFECDVVWIGV